MKTNSWPRHRSMADRSARKAGKSLALSGDLPSRARCACLTGGRRPCPKHNPALYCHYGRHRPDPLTVWLGVWE